MSCSYKNGFSAFEMAHVETTFEIFCHHKTNKLSRLVDRIGI